MSERTTLCLPKSTLFPVEVTVIEVGLDSDVKKHQPILRFKYWTEVEEGDGEKYSKEYHSQFEAPVKGFIRKWHVNVGDMIRGPSDRIVDVEEPCSHKVQWGGLCALCGKSTEEEQDYSEFKINRAPISMSHENNGLTVSVTEAQRIEKGAVARLLKEKKLILVVDLDQTVIHADVDKKIGEWMDDESNPNHAAVRDVKTFDLEEDVVDPETGRRSRQMCRYYVKLRPHLQAFLKNMSKIFELHVYTMATRAYAKNIMQIIDPKGEHFADRVLTRDDSGSHQQKNLHRLFPVSTKLVLIVDDRGDVWSWTPHLLKVVPFNFFRVGDINSSFLPKRQGVVEPPRAEELKQPVAEVKVAEETEESTKIADGGEASNEKSNDRTEPEDAKSVEGGTAAKEEDTESAQLDRSVLLGNHLNESPLAKLEKEQWESEERQAEINQEEPKHQRVLPEDNDLELDNVGNILASVHANYYREYVPGKIEPDVKHVIQKQRDPVFGGLVFLFSGIIPLNIPLNQADIVCWVRSFGAVVVADYVDSVTHCIAKYSTTKKVLRAARNKKVKVVNTGWIFRCMETWTRVSEEPFLLPVNSEVPLEDDEPAATNSKVEDDPNIDEDAFVKGINDKNMDWDGINQELEEFLGSDYDEDEDDDEEEEEENDDKSGDESRSKSEKANETTESRENGGDSKLKRSRSHDEDETPPSSEDDSKRQRTDGDIQEDSDGGDDGYDEDEFARQLESGLL